MKQAYITVPLTIAYWSFMPIENFNADAIDGYIIFGAMLTIGTFTDLGKFTNNKKV